MNICFFLLNRLDYEGGAEKYFVDFARQLSLRGHAVTIICNNYFYIRVRPPLENLVFRLLNVPLRHLRFEEMKRIKRETGGGGVVVLEMDQSSILPFSPKSRSINKLLDEADIIYCKNEFLDVLYLYWLVGVAGFRKVIVGVHTAIFLEDSASLISKLHNFLYFSLVYRRFLQICRATHVANSSYKARIVERFRVDPKKVFYIPYSLPESDFQDPKVADGAFKILFAGRFTEQKGVDYLGQVIDILSHRPEFEDLRFVIVGTGPLEDAVRSLSFRYSNVQSLGYINSGQGMRNIYREVDIAVAPSRWEMFPYNCFEPQASGVPVVAFDIPGSRDIIIDKVTGILISLGEVNLFSQAILDLWKLKKNNKQVFGEMKKNAWRFARERFSTKPVLRAWDLILNQIS